MHKTQRAPVSFQQLCVIAKRILVADPTLDDFEWKHRIKDQLVDARLGFPEQTDLINRAMSAVEKVVKRTAPFALVAAPAPPGATIDAARDAEDKARYERFLREASELLRSRAITPDEQPNRTLEQVAEWRKQNRVVTSHPRTAKGFLRVTRD
jgi:hypothetical protein